MAIHIEGFLKQKMTRIVLAALAVAGTTAAMAQSSVTRYGRVNTTVERHKAGDVSNTGLFNLTFMVQLPPPPIMKETMGRQAAGPGRDMFWWL
jgi:hypothetical protein